MGSNEASLDYLEEFDPSRGVSFWQHLLAGSAAGLAEHCVMFPLDTIKTHAQCVGTCGGRPSADVLCLRAAKSLLYEGYENGIGALRLWRGVGAVTVACVPAHSLYFGMFECVRSASRRHRPEANEVLVNGLAGSLAAVGHDLVMTPADVAKQRLQLGLHRSLADFAVSVARVPGGPWALLYRSLPTTLAMNVPYGSVSVAANEWFKAKWRKDQATPLSVSALLLSGGLAGAMASLATTPLDVVKTRLQTQGAAPPLFSQNQYRKHNHKFRRGGALLTEHGHLLRHHATLVKYHGFLDAAAAIWRLEGPVGFFRGATMRALAQAPSVAIVWTTYELIVAAFRAP